MESLFATLRSALRSAIESAAAVICLRSPGRRSPGRLSIAALLAIGFGTGCSTPNLIEIDNTDSAFYAYELCLESLSRYEDPRKCNSVGTREGRSMSYTDYTFGRHLYESDYQATDSIFRKSSLESEQRTAYREYLAALDEESRQELIQAWQSLVLEAEGVQTH
jgi:hypothetical protein